MAYGRGASGDQDKSGCTRARAAGARPGDTRGTPDLRGGGQRQRDLRAGHHRQRVRGRRHRRERGGPRAHRRAGRRRAGRARRRRAGRGQPVQGAGRLRPPDRRRLHAVPAPGELPAPGHPPLPGPAAVLAPPARHRNPAVQRQLRRRGRLVPDRAAAVRRRHAGDAGGRDRLAVRHRLGAGHGRHGDLPDPVRAQRRVLRRMAPARREPSNCGPRSAPSRTRASTVPWWSRPWAGRRRRPPGSPYGPASCATR